MSTQLPIKFNKLYKGDQHSLLLQVGGENYIFDVASSNIFELDSDEADSLNELVGVPEAKIVEELSKNSTGKAGSLFKSGQLMGPDNRRTNPHLERRLRLYEVVVQMAYSCNMACTYCYADKGEYGGGKAYLMKDQVARDIVDFAFANRGSDKIGFGLLGGEPLLNFSVIKTLVTYAEEKGAKEGVVPEFSVTTNGLPLTEQVVEFLQEHKIAVRLSLDGIKQIHDKYRPDKAGRPTFDRINEVNGKRLKESSVDYMVRASIFGPEGDQIMEQVRTLFEDYSYKRVKVDFLWGADGTPGLITEENLDSVYKGIDALGAWFHEKIMKNELTWKQLMPFSKYIGRLRAKPKVAPVYISKTDESAGTAFGASVLENNGVECGAGVNVISISANGDIYSCHRTEGNSDFKMGTIYEGVKPDALEYWHSNWRLEKSDCRNCWARYVCIGGCPAFGVYKHKDPMKVDHVKCQVRRRFIAWSIWISHQIEKRGKWGDDSTSGTGCASGNCGSRKCNEE